MFECKLRLNKELVSHLPKPIAIICVQTYDHGVNIVILNASESSSLPQKSLQICRATITSK